jgi:hypothetical protein
LGSNSGGATSAVLVGEAENDDTAAASLFAREALALEIAGGFAFVVFCICFWEKPREVFMGGNRLRRVRAGHGGRDRVGGGRGRSRAVRW